MQDRCILEDTENFVKFGTVSPFRAVCDRMVAELAKSSGQPPKSGDFGHLPLKKPGFSEETGFLHPMDSITL